MLLTSGKRMSVFSTSLAIAMPWGSEVLGRRRVSISSDPSSSFGMNSVPRNGTDAEGDRDQHERATDDHEPVAKAQSPGART